MKSMIVRRGQPRKTSTRQRVGPFTVAPETAAALEADRREGESKGAVLDRWARERASIVIIDSGIVKINGNIRRF